MALLWIEGFEGLGTSNGTAPVGLEAKYPIVTTVASMDVEDGRLAGKSLEMAASTALGTPDFGGLTTVVIGFAFKYSSTPSLRTFLRFYEPSATLGLNFRLTAANEIAVYRNITLLGTSSGANLTSGDWHYIEMKSTIHNSAGTVEVKVAGVQVLNLTSKDTQQGGTAQWDTFRLIGELTAQLFTFDDWYILDTTGAQNNDFLGNVRVDTIFPNATGDSAQYTPSAGSNWQNLDDNANDGDTTYNENATTGNKDLVNYESMPTSLGTIKGVQINTLARETDATTFTLKTLAKTGTTESSDTAQTIGTTSYTNIYRVVELDPDTAVAWTESGINGAQFGYETG